MRLNRGTVRRWNWDGSGYVMEFRSIKNLILYLQSPQSERLSRFHKTYGNESSTLRTNWLDILLYGDLKWPNMDCIMNTKFLWRFLVINDNKSLHYPCSVSLPATFVSHINCAMRKTAQLNKIFVWTTRSEIWNEGGDGIDMSFSRA